MGLFQWARHPCRPGRWAWKRVGCRTVFNKAPTGRARLARACKSTCRFGMQAIVAREASVRTSPSLLAAQCTAMALRGGQHLGIRDKGSWFMVYGLWFMIYGLGSRV